MDSNLIFLWMVGLSWLSALPDVIRLARTGQSSWCWVHGLLLVVLVGSVLLDEPEAGHISLIAFVWLWLLPWTVQRRVMALAAAQSYERAQRLSRVVALLHPSAQYRQQPAFLGALALAQRGEVAEAERLLEQLSGKGAEALRSQARLRLFQLRGDWLGFLKSMPPLSERTVRRDPASLAGYLRALGETGQLQALVENYHRYLPILSARPYLQLKFSCQLFVAAFTGRVDVVMDLLRGPLRGMDEAAVTHWVGTAEWARGYSLRGRALLESLLSHQDASVVLAARQRLESPPRLADEHLSPDSQRALAQLGVSVQQEARYGAAQALGPARVTRTLVMLNLVAFVGEELMGGSENPEALFRVGALLSGSFSWAESYRVLTAVFLHFGPLHLAMNMLALGALGPFVEHTLGKVRMLFVYLSAGLTGSLIVALAQTEEPGLFLGASGCIMGLLGATAAILLRGFRSEGALPAKQRLMRVGAVLLLQLAFDLSVPGISMTAHWTGVAVGFLLSFVLTPRAPQRLSPASAA